MYDRDHKTYLWGKFKIKIIILGISWHTTHSAKKSVKWSQLTKKAIRARIIIGFVYPQLTLPNDTSLVSKAFYHLKKFLRQSWTCGTNVVTGLAKTLSVLLLGCSLRYKWDRSFLFSINAYIYALDFLVSLWTNLDGTISQI